MDVAISIKLMFNQIFTILLFKKTHLSFIISVFNGYIKVSIYNNRNKIKL